MLTAARRDHVVSIPDRGPVEPPPLGSWIEYRSEAAQHWWAYAASGELVGTHASIAAAQAALNPNKLAIGE